MDKIARQPEPISASSLLAAIPDNGVERQRFIMRLEADLDFNWENAELKLEELYRSIRNYNQRNA